MTMMRLAQPGITRALDGSGIFRAWLELSKAWLEVSLHLGGSVQSLEVSKCLAGGLQSLSGSLQNLAGGLQSLAGVCTFSPNFKTKGEELITEVVNTKNMVRRFPMADCRFPRSDCRFSWYDKRFPWSN